jgi:predicted nucleotidyltransferase
MGKESLLMSTIRVVIPETLAERIQELGERYGVRKIRVFGSFARGEAAPDSDVDLVVEYVPGKGGFAFVEFCEEVEKLLRRKVDVVTEKSLPPSIRDQVLARAVPL